MPRPRLTRSLPLAEFERWYWLKDELIVFCRTHQLQTSGSKPELAARIVTLLEGGAPSHTRIARRVAIMPHTFHASTVIGDGWRCSPALGAYFRTVCGKRFRFNAAMRTFIHTGTGRTLREAAACYWQSVASGLPPKAIIPQNQYNQHTRDYHAKHPGATRAEVIAAWKAKRASGTVG
jgi:hypothetical protein